MCLAIDIHSIDNNNIIKNDIYIIVTCLFIAANRPGVNTRIISIGQGRREIFFFFCLEQQSIFDWLILEKKKNSLYNAVLFVRFMPPQRVYSENLY